MLSWALKDVSELSWWYLVELSFGISASRESATVEVLKSSIPSWSLSLLFPLNVFYFYFYFYFFEIKKKKKMEKKKKKRKKKKKPKWHRFSILNGSS